MTKLVIKITVDRNIDPELYDAVANVPPRQRGAVIRRLWRQGLNPGSQTVAIKQPADAPGVVYTREPVAAAATGQSSDDADGQRLRQDLDSPGLSGLSAFV